MSSSPKVLSGAAEGECGTTGEECLPNLPAARSRARVLRGRDEIYTGPETASILGLKERDLNGSPNKWIGLLHPEDRDRFKTVLDTMLDHRRGKIAQEFRLRANNGQYH